MIFLFQNGLGDFFDNKNGLRDLTCILRNVTHVFGLQIQI